MFSCSPTEVWLVYRSGEHFIRRSLPSRWTLPQFSSQGRISFYRTCSRQLVSIPSCRRMSTQNKEPKTGPAPPRPSSRFVEANCKLTPFKESTLLTTQCNPHLPPKRSSPPPPRQNIHLLRVCARLPRRKPLAPRRRMSPTGRSQTPRRCAVVPSRGFTGVIRGERDYAGEG